MEAITTGISSVMTMVSTMLTSILDNTVLTVIFSVGFVGLALRTLRKVIKTSKSVG